VDGTPRAIYTERVRVLISWLPVVVLAGLFVAFLLRPRPLDSDAADLTSPAPPTFQPVLVPQGSATLTGRVLDEHGAPVAELPVFARSGETPHWAYTDSQGRFALEHVLDEELELLALAFGRPTQSFRARPTKDEIEFRLGPPREPIARLPDIRRADLHGSLARALEGSSAEFEVLFEPVDPEDVFQGAVPVRTTVAADGTFAVSRLAHGRYRDRKSVV
jgi:hypothetical protein